MPRRRLLYPVCCLMVFGLLAWGSARKDSPTVDEPGHLAAGYAYWKTGNYSLDPLHPPLVRLWASAPLLFLPLRPLYPFPLWIVQKHLSLADWFFHYNTRSPDALLLYSRGMIILLGLGLSAKGSGEMGGSLRRQSRHGLYVPGWAKGYQLPYRAGALLCLVLRRMAGAQPTDAVFQ